MQALSTALALGLGVVLARTLGPDGYGIYAFAFALMSLLMVVAEAGVPTLVMREVAAAEAREQGGLLRGALRRGLQFVAIVSVFVSVVGILCLTLIADRIETTNLYTLGVMLLALPIAALAKTLAHALKGLRRVVMAQALELLLRPVLVLASVVGMALVLSPSPLTPSLAMGGQLVAAIVVGIFSFILLRRTIVAIVRKETLEFRSREWLKSALPLSLIGAALVINSQIDVVMLGWFEPDEQVGIYRVAVQGSVLVILSLQAVTAVVTPYIARLYAQGDTALLQRIVTRAAQASALPALLIVILLVGAGQDILSWVFGPEYAAAHVSLVILAMGRLAVAVLGICGPLLTMTGFERLQSQTIWFAVVANVILNLTLIPWLGVVGAAISTALTAFGWIALLALIAQSRLRICVSPIRFRQLLPGKIKGK